MSAIVIMPTYNEAENLRLTAVRLRRAAPKVHLLVVDDASPDGTGQIADDLAARDDHIRVLHRTGKDGLGAAYRAGISWALHQGFDILIEMDADGSHQPEQLPNLLARISTTGVDIVVGSRWVPGGRTVNWPIGRRLISRAGSTYARIALRLRTRDVTSGYRAYTRQALHAIDVERLTSQGYCFQIDMLRRAVYAGLRIEEEPITFIEREHGTSKMTPGIIAEAMLRVTAWALYSRPRNGRQCAPDRKLRSAPAPDRTGALLPPLDRAEGQ
ncbi:polyprenol monophosphomannose synthase [Leifsonia shinshuensis]